MSENPQFVDPDPALSAPLLQRASTDAGEPAPVQSGASSLPTLTWNSTTSTPTASAPSVQAPPIQAPTASAPSVEAPTMQAPAVQAPAVLAPTQPLVTAPNPATPYPSFPPTPVPPPPPGMTAPFGVVDAAMEPAAVPTPTAHALAADTPSAPHVATLPTGDDVLAAAEAPAPNVAYVPAVEPAPVATPAPVVPAAAAVPAPHVQMTPVPLEASVPVMPAAAAPVMPAAAVPVMPAAVAAPAAAVGGPMLPTVAASVAPPLPDAAASPLAIESSKKKSKKKKNNQPPKRRVINAIGWLVRTIIIAAFVAAAVFGARYGYQWYLDRDAVDIELPAQAIAPPPVRVIDVQVTATGVAFTATKDLSTGDAAIDANGTAFARSAGVLYAQNADQTWSAVSAADLVTLAPFVEQLDNASLLTFTDVFPVEMHSYLTVVSAADSQVRGRALVGDSVFPVADGGSDAPGADVLEAANDVAGTSLDLTSSVPVRVVEVVVDREALTSADAVLAERLGFTGSTDTTVTVTVDEVGVVRSMSAETGVGTNGTSYTLTAVLSSTTNPLDGIDLTAGASAPAEETEEL